MRARASGTAPAEVVGGRVVVHACTQAPVMDRDALADVLGMEPSGIRVVPTAVGGGFGTKLDLSVQPFLAIAALRLGRPVRMAYSRTESMQATTKRHPSRIRMRIGARRDGVIEAMEFEGCLDTGAHASWRPTVANRVPIHALGPYHVPTTEPARARCTPTASPRAPSAASACRSRPSRRRACSTSWRNAWGWTRWSCASRTR